MDDNVFKDENKVWRTMKIEARPEVIQQDGNKSWTPASNKINNGENKKKKKSGVKMVYK